MKVELQVPGDLAEPRIWARHEQALGMALQPGSIEVGSRRSEMSWKIYNAGEISREARADAAAMRNDDRSVVERVADGLSGDQAEAIRQL